MNGVKLNFVFFKSETWCVGSCSAAFGKKERLMLATGFALYNSKHILVSTDTFTPKLTCCAAIVLCWRQTPKMHDG